MKEPFVIKTLTAFVSVHPKDGDEGIIGRRSPDGAWMPFIAADEKRIISLRPFVDEILNQEPGMIVKLVRFSVRTDLETITNKK